MPVGSEFLIVHVSDLHFGREFYGHRTTAQSPTSGRTNSVGATPQGLRTHDVEGCAALANAIERLLQKRRPKVALLAVTGDLSVEGSDSEFSLSHTFLSGRIPRTRRLTIGLADIVKDIVCVPGNHDHWNGWNSKLFPIFLAQGGPVRGIHGPWFEGPAWHRAFGGQGVQLDVIGLDSCAGPGWRFGARGKLDSAALGALGARLPQPNAGGNRSIRVALMHHPPNPIGLTHALDSASVKDFASFCGMHDVKVVLTGHTHEPASLTPNGGCPVYELRCGTTLQSSPPGKAPPKGWTFLVHSVDRDGAHFRWTTEEYCRFPVSVSHSGRFQLVNSRRSFRV